MTILAIDTALASLRLALLGEALSISHSLDMPKGQSEALFPAIGSLLQEAELAPQALSGIAVNIGPGSFTGTRVGVAAAKGLGFALQIPVHGITMFEALALEAEEVPRAVLVDARRGEVYLQLFEPDGSCSSPEAVKVEALGSHKFEGRLLIGSGASLVTGHPQNLLMPMEFADPLKIARLAASGLGKGEAKPFYLRGADAKPQLDKVLKRQDQG